MPHRHKNKFKSPQNVAKPTQRSLRAWEQPKYPAVVQFKLLI